MFIYKTLDTQSVSVMYHKIHHYIVINYLSLPSNLPQLSTPLLSPSIPTQPTPPPKHPHPTTTPPLHFFDSPYTEWISQRWTLSTKQNFSNWPSLPPYINSIQQISSGNLGGDQGLWFLTNSTLYFALNLDGGPPELVQFIDLSEGLEIDILPDSRIAVDITETLYVATPYNVTMLECSEDFT